MAASWGHKLKITLFGESHGSLVGIVIDAFPAGIEIDRAAIEREMARRRPGTSPLSSARNEPDRVEIVSGVLNNKTTGAPICGIIRNQDTRSEDYQPALLRPGHADWSAWLKHHGHADMRGGGIHSGRMTAPLVFAGALAKQLLLAQNVTIYSRILQIEHHRDAEIPQTADAWQTLPCDFPVADSAIAAQMKQSIEDAKAAGDSVGGVIEAAVFGLPGGVGDPFFDSMESTLASLLFSVPAVKGVEFGGGFALAAQRGSTTNDPIYLDGGTVRSKSNHSGGILGGIANGMPLIARAAIKPTPTIARPQQSVDISAMQEIVLQNKGRHDPCILPRALPVVEAMLALGCLELMMEGGFLP
jgi:chorismate synthase